MKLSRNQLRIIHLIGDGEKDVNRLATALNRSKSQVYRTIKKLQKDGILLLQSGRVELIPKTHINLLVRILVDYPNLVDLLSGSSIPILAEFLEPRAVNEVVLRTGIKKDTVYNCIRDLQDVSILRKEDDGYCLNQELWGSLGEFMAEYRRYEDSIDPRVKPESTIYFKNDEEIVFSSRSSEDASITGFSAYKDYGIKILTTKHYYTLPRRNLDVKEVFMHSLYITEKEHDIRNLIFIALFYLKNKDKIKGIDHKIFVDMKKVLRGQALDDYPDLDEIRDRAKVYGIRV